ncbi:MAG: phosphosulfolactate synthase, partial [Gammaproteobacteria bacterium]|nr:phosphosulfolactate synthase [Gammaproteobacteria bacterium]
MSQRPFDFIELPPVRSVDKPRSNGLTMMIDWGLGLRRLEDSLEMSGDFVDLGKIAVGTPRLYREDLLRRKFEIYESHAIRPFLGGMFIEHYLEAQGMDAMGRFYDEAARVGFKVIEVSDNLRPFSSNERRHL